MALIKCPSCGKEVSNRAKECPKCFYSIAEYVLKERFEQERQEKERQEKERQEKERQEKERQERERQEKERQERERQEKEHQEKERQERERQEKERQERERQEKERQERERQEKERQEKERSEENARERECLRQQRIEEDNTERARLQKTREDQDRKERERLELERIEFDQFEKERLEKIRIEFDKNERDKLENLRLVQDKKERELLEEKRRKDVKAEEDRKERNRCEQELLEKERLEKDQVERKKLEQERIEYDKIARQQLEEERLNEDRLERERLKAERESSRSNIKKPKTHLCFVVLFAVIIIELAIILMQCASKNENSNDLLNEGTSIPKETTEKISDTKNEENNISEEGTLDKSNSVMDGMSSTTKNDDQTEQAEIISEENKNVEPTQMLLPTEQLRDVVDLEGVDQLTLIPTEKVEPSATPTVMVTEKLIPTENPIPTEKPIPTENPIPTEKPIPTENPIPTEKPIPTEIPMPTEKPLDTPEITPTPMNVKSFEFDDDEHFIIATQGTVVNIVDYGIKRELSWKVENPKIAHVSVDNSETIIWADAVGSTNIIVFDQFGNERSVKVSVVEVTLNCGDISLKKGEQKQLIVDIKGPDNCVIENGWFTDDEKIASIDENGLITANGVGKVNLGVSVPMAGLYWIQVSVIEEKTSVVSTFELSTDERWFIAGQGTRIEVDDFGIERNIKWKTADPKIVKLNEQLNEYAGVEGVACGETVVTAEDQYGNKKQVKISVVEVSFNTGDVTLKKGEQKQLKVDIKAPNNQKIINGWFTDDKSIASIDSNGVITANGKGKVNVGASIPSAGLTWITVTVN